KHKFLIGDRTAEQLKLAYVALRRDADGVPEGTMSARGRCLLTGLPKSMDVDVAELDRVVEKHIELIVRVVRDVLGRTEPELSQDIHDKGILLTGGGALMPLVSSMIAEATGLEVKTAAQPTQCVA